MPLPWKPAARASPLPGGHVAGDVRGAAPGTTRFVACSVDIDKQAGRRAGCKNFPPETAASPAPPPLNTTLEYAPGRKKNLSALTRVVFVDAEFGFRNSGGRCS